MAKNKILLKVKKDNKRKIKSNKKNFQGYISKGLYISRYNLRKGWSVKKNYVDESEYIRYYLPELNYFELKDLEKNLAKRYEVMFDIIKNNGEEKELLMKNANDLYNKLYLVRIYINRFNEYKTISVDDSLSTCEQDIVTYRFSGKPSKKIVDRWLEKNDLKKGYKPFHIYSDYDCTGELTSRNIERNGKSVTIYKWYDV